LNPIITRRGCFQGVASRQISEASYLPESRQLRIAQLRETVVITPMRSHSRLEPFGVILSRVAAKDLALFTKAPGNATDSSLRSE